MKMLIVSGVLFAALGACGSHAAAPQAETAVAQKGVYVADLDRSADPCTDFFRFSNGTWRKDHPGPRVDGPLEPPLGSG